MKISAEAKQEIRDIVMKDYLKNNHQESGKIMTLLEMENLVTEIGQQITQPALDSIIENEKLKISSQKKTAHDAKNPGSLRGIDLAQL